MSAAQKDGKQSGPREVLHEAARAGDLSPGKEPLTRALSRRFYTEASVRAVNSPPQPSPIRREEDAGSYQILLDGRPVRTPKKHHLALPTLALAKAIAAEWAAQADVIDPETMPLTRLANVAIDAVGDLRGEVAADIVAFAGTDLLCYRAEAPRELVALQAANWDPVLAWAEGRLRHRFMLAEGVMPVVQRPETLAAVAEALSSLDAFRLTSLHVMTALTGSALLALAHAEGQIGLVEAWVAAHVDEDWQISQWGEDSEAAERRARRWAEMVAASRLLELLA